MSVECVNCEAVLLKLMLWSSWNTGASPSGFKLESLSIRFLLLWFRKMLKYSLSRLLSISNKQGLKRKFQVGVLGSHPFRRYLLGPKQIFSKNILTTVNPIFCDE